MNLPGLFAGLIMFSFLILHNHTSANDSLTSKLSGIAGVKIMRSFLTKFEDPKDLKFEWLGKNLLLKFTSGGKYTRSLFARNGHILYTIVYGDEKDMPARIRAIVKSAYYDHVITVVNKLVRNHRETWIVHLKEKDSHLVVRVTDDDMEVLKSYYDSRNPQ